MGRAAEHDASKRTAVKKLNRTDAEGRGLLDGVA
jgi:hypothetical protein